MTELDRQAAVAVFRAAAATRRQGRNDRLFSLHHHHLASAAEALRQMEAVERLSKAAVFEMFFDRLASFSSSAHLVQMFDSTMARAHVSPIFHSAIY
jgi:hypothetical protein